MKDEVAAVLILLALLQVKHFLADYVLQSAFILKNRRRYGHPGGLLHAGIHALGSGACLAVLGTGFTLSLTIVVVEAVVHYHIDWAKDNTVAAREWTPSDRSFWIATGVDQALHQLTYLAMVAYWTTQFFS